MARDTKQSDVLNILKTELNKEVKDDLDKVGTMSLEYPYINSLFILLLIIFITFKLRLFFLRYYVIL